MQQLSVIIVCSKRRSRREPQPQQRSGRQLLVGPDNEIGLVFATQEAEHQFGTKNAQPLTSTLESSRFSKPSHVLSPKSTTCDR